MLVCGDILEGVIAVGTAHAKWWHIGGRFVGGGAKSHWPLIGRERRPGRRDWRLIVVVVGGRKGCGRIPTGSLSLAGHSDAADAVRIWCRCWCWLLWNEALMVMTIGRLNVGRNICSWRQLGSRSKNDDNYPHPPPILYTTPKYYPLHYNQMRGGEGQAWRVGVTGRSNGTSVWGTRGRG